MLDFFEIDSKPFKLSEVKEYAIVLKELILRPVFREPGKFFGPRYQFAVMEPYGIIVDENSNRAAMTSFKPNDLIGAVVKDAMRPVNAIVDGLSDKFNIKTVKDKEYLCKLLSGRLTKVYLKDVPAKLIDKNQQNREIYSNTPEYKELGMSIQPAVEEIRTLEITFKKDREPLLFFGEGFTPVNIDQVYNDLKIAILNFQSDAQKLEAERFKIENIKIPQVSIPKITLPKVELPKIELPNIGFPKITVSFGDSKTKTENKKEGNST